MDGAVAVSHLVQSPNGQCAASESVRQCYRTKAAQVGVELGLID